MDVKIIAIDSSFNLETGDLSGGLVLRLPDGQIARVQASHDVVEHLQSLLTSLPPPLPAPRAAGVVRPPPEPQRVPPPEPVTIELADPPAPVPDLIRWELLPKSVLSQTMRDTFVVLGVPDRLTKEQLSTVMEDVRKMAAESVQPPAQPSIGEVVWNNSSMREMGSKHVPIRFPQKTNAGYPVVQEVERIDPGEIPEDDDGAGQI